MPNRFCFYEMMAIIWEYRHGHPKDDGLSACTEMLRRDKMDLWIVGLLGLSSRKTIDTGC
jgi:hypothetical protein